MKNISLYIFLKVFLLLPYKHVDEKEPEPEKI